MALPFFKKSDDKMPARPAAKPASARTSEPASKPPAVEDDLGDLDFTGIQVVEEVDPLVGAIEQAAIAFANDRNEETEATLKAAIAGRERTSEAERLWLMLFDYYLVAGRREAFSALEMDYARLFEKQPPVWRENGKGTAKTAVAGASVFKGELVGANAEGFAQLEQWLAADTATRVDFSKVSRVDGEGCEKLLAIVQKLRRLKKSPVFVGCEALVALLRPRVEAGDKQQAYWRALLECYQMLGRAEDFENLALEFAVTFEISPPSWEEPPAGVKPAGATKVASVSGGDDAFVLRGEIRGGRFDGLDAYLAQHAHAVVDMTEVTRLDFASGGSLLNLLSPHRGRGAEITLRHPNRLVGELLGLMGIGSVATVVFAKR